MDKPIPDGGIVVKYQGPAAELIPYGMDRFDFKDMGPMGWKVDREQDMLVISTSERGRVMYPMVNIFSIRVIPNGPDYAANLADYLIYQHNSGGHGDKFIRVCPECQAGDLK